jgi:ketosteroid isomerase-like protein
MKKLLSLLIICLAVINMYAQKAEEKEGIIKKIKDQNQKLALFYKNMQADSIAGLFSPNCHIAREFENIAEGRDQVLALYKKDFKSGTKITNSKFEVIEHKVYDDVVMEIGKHTLEYTTGTDKTVRKTQQNYIFLWKESKSGKYQIRAAFWNSAKNPCS